MMRIISVLVVGISLLGFCHGQPCSVDEFTARLSDIECMQTDRQPVFDVFSECGHDDFAEELVDNCRTHNNETCSEMLNTIVFRGPLEIRSCYRDDAFQERLLPCTTECKEDLEAYINDTLGCCSHSLIEDILLEAFPSIVLIKGLLDACNVTVLDPCTTPSTLSFTPSGASEPSCSRSEVSERLAVASCLPEALDPRLELFRDCMYPSEPSELACEQDDDGIYCATYVFDSAVLALFDAVDTNCIEGTETCSDSCRAAVVSLRQDVGCCANNVYNNSLFSQYSTSYELWSLCEVETLQYCSESGGVPTAGVTKLFFAIVVLVLALVF